MENDVAEARARLGRQNLDAARDLLRLGHWRSCVSRSYYAAMAASHAILIRMKKTPPVDRGGWSHNDLPALLHWCLMSSPLRRGAVPIAVAKVHRIELSRCYARRVLADYHPIAVVSQGDAAESVKCAGRLLRRWEELR